MYQKKIAFGSKGFPWTIAHSKISYKKGICPVAERLHDFDLFNVFMFENYYVLDSGTS